MKVWPLFDREVGGRVLGKHSIQLEELEGGTHHALVQKLFKRCQGLNRL